MRPHLNSSEPGALTWSEIRQQPSLWQNTLERVAAARPGLPLLAKRPVVITGAGTSAHAASAIAHAGVGIIAIPTTELLSASRDEVARAAPGFEGNGLLVSLGRSGNSPESLAVIERICRFFPAVQHLAITCNPEGKLGQIDYVRTLFLDPQTNDRSLVMTSSFSNLVLAGLLLLHFEKLSESLPRICARAEQSMPEMLQLAEEIASYPVNRAIVLASGSLLALAAEGALKILEMTAGEVVAMPESYLGLRHGPMSFLRHDTLVISFLSSDPVKRNYEMDLLKELQEKKLGRITTIGNTDAIETQADIRVPSIAPDLPDYLRTPFEVVFAQIIGYQLSLKAGLDPDHPSPDNVITRVVPPFRIYSEGL